MFLTCGYILLQANFRPQRTRMEAGERVTEEKRELWLERLEREGKDLEKAAR